SFPIAPPSAVVCFGPLPPGWCFRSLSINGVAPLGNTDSTLSGRLGFSRNQLKTAGILATDVSHTFFRVLSTTVIVRFLAAGNVQPSLFDYIIVMPDPPVGVVDEMYLV